MSSFIRALPASSRWSAVLALALLLGFACPPPAPGQSVDKVEPGNWWTGMQWNEVQLMLYGTDLDGITARVPKDGVTVTAVHSMPNASYAFVDVTIADDATPGTYTLQLQKGETTLSVDYPILAREDRANRHQGFGPEDVVYLITPDRFANGDPSNDRVEGMRDEYDPSDPAMRHGGDLQGIIDRLDFLNDLGVTTLWLNPVLENRGVNSYHGYKTTDFYRIDPRFGTNDDYRRLVAEAHDRDLKVIFDHVSNHIGIEHPWMDDLPRQTWLNGSEDDHASEAHYKMSITDPHADPESEHLLRTFWFVDSMPDLNQKDPYLATYLIQNSLWWIETSGLDGIREDTYPYPDQAFLADWADAILTEYPDFNIVGEIWDTAPAFTALFQKDSPLQRDFETNLPSVMDFALSEAFRDYLRGDEGLSAVYQVIAQDFLYANTDGIMTLFDNHDMPRGIFVADGDEQRLQQVMTMLLTTRGVPQILYGTEIGMRGGESHVELREDYPGGFPGDERDAFTEAGRTDAEQRTFAFTRDLLHLRKTHPALTRGTLTHYPPRYGHDVYTYVREHEGETILVVISGHDEPKTVDLTEELATLGTPLDGVRLTDLRTGEVVPWTDDARAIRVDARAALVLDVTRP